MLALRWRALGFEALPVENGSAIQFRKYNTLALNATPAGWTVTDGTVDIIGQDSGNGQFFNLVPGHGVYIDLDGSTGHAGLLSINLNLDANVDYTASFSLAGNHRWEITDTVTATFGSSSLLLENIPGYQDFTTYSLAFTPSTSGVYALSFRNAGGDNIGALLDNVSVAGASPVPLPAAAWLLGPALLGLGRRKARSLDA